MTDDSKTPEGARRARNRRINRKVLPTDREVLLARLLLLVADTIAAEDRDQEFIELYNGIKSLVEETLRHGS